MTNGKDVPILKDKVKYTQRYRRKWEDDKRFKGWLQPVPDDVTKAQCKVCGCSLKAHMRSVLGHLTSKKHVDKMKSQITYVYRPIKEEPVKEYGIEEHEVGDIPLQANITVTEQPEHDQESSGSEPTSSAHIMTYKKEQKKYKKIKAMQEIPNSLETENEFALFGRSVGTQLQQLPLVDALELQVQIQTLIAERRMKLLRGQATFHTNSSLNGPSEEGHHQQQGHYTAVQHWPKYTFDSTNKNCIKVMKIGANTIATIT